MGFQCSMRNILNQEKHFVSTRPTYGATCSVSYKSQLTLFLGAILNHDKENMAVMSVVTC